MRTDTLSHQSINHPGNIKKSLAISITIMLTLLILLSIVAPATAQEDRSTPDRNVPTAPSQGPTDRAELEAFLDELLGKEMEEYHIAGRAYYTLVTVTAVAFVWFMNYWNLLGWRF